MTYKRYGYVQNSQPANASSGVFGYVRPAKGMPMA